MNGIYWQVVEPRGSLTEKSEKEQPANYVFILDIQQSNSLHITFVMLFGQGGPIGVVFKKNFL